MVWRKDDGTVWDLVYSSYVYPWGQGRPSICFVGICNALDAHCHRSYGCDPDVFSPTVCLVLEGRLLDTTPPQLPAGHGLCKVQQNSKYDSKRQPGISIPWHSIPSALSMVQIFCDMTPFSPKECVSIIWHSFFFFREEQGREYEELREIVPRVAES